MFRVKLLVLLAIITGVTCFLWVSSATSRGFRVAELPDKGANWSCGTCHVNPAGGGARNAFGKDWQNIAVPAGDTYVNQLAQADSDGDGFTNDQEFNANPPTKPGDATSKPPSTEPQAVKKRNKRLTVWAKLKRR